MNKLASAILVATLAPIVCMRSAESLGMRADFYDPALTNSTKEVRYRNLGAQSRFAPVGAIVNGAVGFTNSFAAHCSGTLIGPNTMITAAHCFRYTPDETNIDLSQLSIMYVAFGPDITTPSTVLRITAYILHPDWIAGNFGESSLGGDLALVQVYDVATNGPVSTITPALLYSTADELANTNFPVITGFGFAMYGANIPAPGPTGGTPVDAGGIKRGSLTSLVGLSTQSAFMDTLLSRFRSPGTLNSQGLPSNFLEGSLTPGDSGGGLFLPDPANVTITKLAGVNSWVERPAAVPEYDDTWAFRYELFPLTGGATAAFGRISSKIGWIQANMFGPATPYVEVPPNFDPGLLIASSGSPVTFSAPATVNCGNSTMSVNYSFPDAAGAVSIYFAGLLQGTISASGAGFANVSIPVNTAVVGCGSGGTGRVLTKLIQQIKFVFTAPTGSRLLFDSISFPVVANGDFARGLAGWSSSPTSAISIVNVANFGADRVFANGFE